MFPVLAIIAAGVPACGYLAWLTAMRGAQAWWLLLICAAAAYGLLAVGWRSGYRRLAGADAVTWGDWLPLVLPAVAPLGLLFVSRDVTFVNSFGPHKYVLLAMWVLFATGAAAALLAAVLRRLAPGAEAGMLLFAAALLIYGAALPAVRLHEVHGDEPYYLWMTASIIADGDIDLSNNVAVNLHERLTRYPHADGGISHYAGYLPTYSMLLLPGFLAGGISGALLSQVLLAALLAVQLFRLLTAAYPGSPGRFPALIAAAFTPPLLTLTTHCYPEIAAAFLLTVALRLLLAPGLQRGNIVMVGGIAALLPWLHERYVYLAAALLLVLVLRGRRAWRWMLAVGAGVVLSGMALRGFRAMFIPPGFVPGGLWLAPGQFVSQVLRYYIDQEYGLLFLSPVYLLLPLAVILAARSRRLPELLGLTVLAAFAAFHGLFRIWGAGSVGGRYLAPMVPALALLLVPVFARQGRWFRGITYALLAGSLGLSMLVSIAPVFRFEQVNGINRWLGTMLGIEPAIRWFPSLVQPYSHFTLPLDALDCWWLTALLPVTAGLALLSSAKEERSEPAAEDERETAKDK